MIPEPVANSVSSDVVPISLTIPVTLSPSLCDSTLNVGGVLSTKMFLESEDLEPAISSTLIVNCRFASSISLVSTSIFQSVESATFVAGIVSTVESLS